MRIKYGIVMLLLCASAYMVYTPRELVEPETRGLQSFPEVVGEWKSVSNTLFDAPVLKVLRPSDYLMRTYVNPKGEFLSLYVGYHNGGKDSGPIHSPKNCLPGAGWFPLSDTTMTVRAGEADIRLVRADFVKDSQKITFYYWYQIRNTSVTRDIDLKLAELKGMIFENRKDASFIRIDLDTSPGHERTDALVEDFLRDAYPLLKSYLPS